MTVLIVDGFNNFIRNFAANQSVTATGDLVGGVVGFIIVELGECKAYPKAYSINLICTNNNAISGSGSILMGLYLYTILSHPNINNMNTKNITFPKGNATRNIIQKPSVSDEEPIIETIITKI